VLDETSPFYSHVVLSPGSGGSSEDGLLEAWEMVDLGLRADLVILSACETGRGRIAPGEGIVGTDVGALRRNPRYAHPFHWAGFVLVGNPY
jgi:CHAT domain-containing protein